MTSFYKCLLPIFCFACVSATATPTQITPKTSINANLVSPSYIKKPDFEIGSHAFPACDCDEQGKPLSSCQEQTATAMIKFIVDTDGKTKNIQVMQSLGTAKADRYLVQRFWSARFSPAMQNNQPIVSLGQQTITIKYMPELNPLTCPIEKPKNQELLKQIHNFN